jgi:hypothetical protein
MCGLETDIIGSVLQEQGRRSSVEGMMEGLQLATSPSVVRRACVVAVVVGTVLVAINHGDAILRGDFSLGRGVRIVLTVLVPYCVSTYSSVGATLDQRSRAETRPRDSLLSTPRRD